MQNKILSWLVIVLSIILIGVVSFKKETNFSLSEEPKKEISKETKEETKEETIKVYDSDLKEILEMNLEDYILGVVAAEMPASFELEALKAQAVAARTFAIYKKETRNEEYDVIKGVSDQAYNTKEEMQKKWQENYQKNYEKIAKSIEETKGEILTFEDQVIESFYFSMSNGYTEKCELVFQQELPYLKSVESSWDNENLNNYEVTKTFSKSEFCTLLNISNCEKINITDINRTESGRVYNLKINDILFKGTKLRQLLTLRSTDFDIKVEENITITTRGSGHGVGMSQYGANGMAKEGASYQEILKYFYQNVEITKI